MRRNAMVYCCRGKQNSGAVHRSVGLASKLCETLDVTVLLDEDTPLPVDLPASLNLVKLPMLAGDPESVHFDPGISDELRQSVIRRRDVILAEFESLKPRVVIVDSFPFELIGLRGEVLPMIERARNGIYGDVLVVCITDGILVNDSSNGEDRDDLAADLLNKYFDLVVVQSDRVFARLEEFFKPGNTLHTPLYHTGFVMPDGATSPVGGGAVGKILVSAGDGRYGGALYRSAIEAQRVLWPVTGLLMRLIAGWRLPENEYRDLVERASDVDGLEIVREVASLHGEIRSARCSISQCGYRTALYAMSSRTPSLFVPCSENRQGAQTVRAQRLVYWGAGRLLSPHHLNAASLTNEINQVLQLQPREIRFDTSGAANAARLIDKAMHFADVGSETLRSASMDWGRQ